MNPLKQVLFRIDKKLYKDFCDECAHRGLIKTKILGRLIEEWLEKNKQRKIKNNE
jgi:hypothetical protein